MKLTPFNQWRFDSREEAEAEIKEFARLEKGQQVMYAVEGGKEGEWYYGTFIGLDAEGDAILLTVDKDNTISTILCSWDFIAMPRANSGRE